MSNTDVIREFLVELGFKIDQKGLKDFREGVEGVTKAVTRLAATVTSAIVTVGTGVTLMASRLDKLQFSADRVKASASNLKAFEHAAKNLGIETSASLGSIEALAQKMRHNPAMHAYAGSLGVVTKKANGEMRDTVDIATDLITVLSDLPAEQASLVIQYPDIFGFDENLVLAARGGKLKKELTEAKAAVGGIDFDQAAKDSQAFMKGMRDLGLTLYLFSTKVQAALAGRLAPELQKFRKWVETHGPGIATKVADLALLLLDACVKLAPYIGAMIDKFIEWDEATGGLSTQLIAVAGVLHALGGSAVIAGIARIATAVRGVGPRGVSAAGKLGLLGKLGAVGAAAAGGWGIGRLIGNNLSDSTNDAIGEFVARVFAFFGNEEAAEALAVNAGAHGGSTTAVPTKVGSATTGGLANSAFGKLIARGEGDYNSVNRGQRHGYKSGTEDLENMTLNEVMQGQRDKRFNAVGRYQLIPSTLAEGTRFLGLSGDEKFDRKMQDRLFEQYLVGHKRKAIADFISGKSDNLQAALLAVSQEWASATDPNTGRSHYARDGVNKASIGLKEMEGALLSVRDARIGGASASGVQQSNTANINVYGATDPMATARAVGDHQVYVGERNSRTLQGVIS